MEASSIEWKFGNAIDCPYGLPYIRGVASIEVEEAVVSSVFSDLKNNLL